MSDFFEKIQPQEKLKVNSVGAVFDSLARLAERDGRVRFMSGGKVKEYPLWKDDLALPSVATRVTKFMGDERGILFVPSGGDQVALRESLVAGVYSASGKVDVYTNQFNNDINEIMPDQKIDSTGKPVRITVDARTGYITDLIIDIKQLSGQDEFEPKEGLRVSQIEPVLAACRVNEETCRREEQGVGMEKLVPNIIIIDSERQYHDVKVGVPLLQHNSVI